MASKWMHCLFFFFFWAVCFPEIQRQIGPCQKNCGATPFMAAGPRQALIYDSKLKRMKNLWQQFVASRKTIIELWSGCFVPFLFGVSEARWDQGSEIWRKTQLIITTDDTDGFTDLFLLHSRGRSH